MEGVDPRHEARRLIAARRWCALGTSDAHGTPSVTYVPFAPVNGTFGIVVSALAAHTANLRARRSASIMLVGDDDADAYARHRFTIAVTASPAQPGSALAESVWSALEARHGDTARTLRTLTDFQAIALVPQDGRLVLGFAAAHHVDASTIGGLLRA